MINDLHTAFLLGVAIVGAGWAFDHWYMARSLDHAAERAQRLQRDLMVADADAIQAQRAAAQKIEMLTVERDGALAALKPFRRRRGPDGKIVGTAP